MHEPSVSYRPLEKRLQCLVCSRWRWRRSCPVRDTPCSASVASWCSVMHLPSTLKHLLKRLMLLGASIQADCLPGSYARKQTLPPVTQGKNCISCCVRLSGYHTISAEFGKYNNCPFGVLGHAVSISLWPTRPEYV